MYLVLAPHTDDAEFGCGGTISKLVDRGADVYCASFSFAVKSLPSDMPSDSTAKEFYDAMDILGVKKENIITYDYEVRVFTSFRQDILEGMVKLNKEIKPNLVFLPNSKDTHQDHHVIHNEGYRAFKKGSLLGFESLWNNSIFIANFFVCLDKSHVDRKLKALACYKSQHTRDSGKGEIMEMLARFRGSQIGKEYAECFEDIRYIIN